MKKRMALILAAACALALAGGCGEKDGDQQEKGQVESPAPQEDSKEEKEGAEEAADYEASDYVELGEYKGLQITLGSYEVSDEDVKSNIESMLYAYPVYEDSDKDTVEDGDTVNIDYEGIKDGVAFDGGTAQGAYLDIGSGNFIEGFEEGLIGKKVGEKVSLDLTFPESYGNKDLAGQAVVFKVTVNKIVTKKEITYDEMTDEFVKDNFSMQGYENVADFKKGIKEELEASNESKKGTDIENAIIEKLAENCTVKSFPEGLLDKSYEEYLEQFETGLKDNYGMELEEYAKTLNTTEEEFKEQVKANVENSLKNQLILEAIAKKENISVDEEGFSAYKQGIVTDYGYESEEALLEQHGEEYVKRAYLSTKTMEMLTENAKITYDKNAGTDADSGDAQEGAVEK